MKSRPPIKRNEKMENPFNFNIDINSKSKFKRWAAYAATAFILMTAFVAGFITVYVNSYNVMNSEPMNVLEFLENGVIFLNHYYEYSIFSVLLL